MNIKETITNEHFEITEEFTKLMFCEEFDSIPKGKLLTFDSVESPKELISLMKKLTEELKAIKMEFNEYVDEFFSCTNPLKYFKGAEKAKKFGPVLENTGKTLKELIHHNIPKMTSEEIKDINSVMVVMHGVFTSIIELEKRFSKYISIFTEIKTIRDSSEESFEDSSVIDLVVQTTKVIDNMNDVVDEHTISTFSQKQLKDFRESCLLHIKNSKELVNIGISMNPDEKEEELIRQLMNSTIRLVTTVKQIDMFIK